MQYDNHAEPQQGDHRGWLEQLFGLTTPGNYIVGMITDVAEAEAATRELRQAAAHPDDVQFVPAEEAARRAGGNGSGPAMDIFTERSSYCADYNERAIGSAIISMSTRSGDEVARAYRILAAHDAHEIVYFGDWTIKRLPRRSAYRDSNGNGGGADRRA
jgi:hypothetical protein